MALLCLVVSKVDAATLTKNTGGFNNNSGNTYELGGTDVTFYLEGNGFDRTRTLVGQPYYLTLNKNSDYYIKCKDIKSGYDVRITKIETVAFEMGVATEHTLDWGTSSQKWNYSSKTVTYTTTCYGSSLNFQIHTGNEQFQLRTITIEYELIQKVNMSVSAGKYGTFCAPFAFGKHGVKAYTVSSVTNTVLELAEVSGDNIPANTPVVIYNEGGSDVNENEWGVPATENTCESGLLVGLLKAVEVPANSYILTTLEGGQKFYKLNTASTGKANRCYLKEGNYSSAKILSFCEEDATGISAIDALNSGADIYSVNGVKTNSLQKGMNIVKMANGSVKKIYVK